MEEDTTFIVNADTLDNILLRRKEMIIPTFIKVDIEGYEKKFLNGAKETIKRYHPVIAVAIYHQASDLYTLPCLLKKMVPDYKMYIRSYMNINETILYAVTPERMVL